MYKKNSTTHLSKPEQFDLLVKYKLGNEKEKYRIREKLLKHYLGHIIRCTKSYFAAFGREEAINIGCIGFIEAINEIDVSRNASLTTVSYFWIKHELIRAVNSELNIVSIPNDKVCSQNNDIEISYTYLDDDASSDGAYSHFSSNLEGLDLDMSSEDTIDKRMDIIQVMRSVLPKRTYDIVCLYHGLNENEPLTLQAIGDKYNLSRERIRQIILGAMNRMRNKLKSYKR